MRRRLASFAFTLLLALPLVHLPPAGASVAGAPPNPLYVDASAGGAETGETWHDAMTDLQAALAAVPSGSGIEIWVAEGTYVPGTDPPDTFELENGVTLYGGFPEKGGTFEERDPSAYPTILSGVVKGGNAYHVVLGKDLDATAILDGFTVRDGHAVDAGPDPLDDCGGGMLLDHASATLRNLIFRSNIANGAGGGLFSVGTDGKVSHPTLEDVDFYSNQATEGGGMANDYSDPSLSQCYFYGNEADYGGGMANVDSSPTLTWVYVTYNTATTDGGGIHNERSHPTLEGCDFYRNDAAGNGGGMANLESNPSMSGRSFQYNTASWGGGVWSEDSDLSFVDVTFERNTAAGTGGAYGGGAMFVGGKPEMTNVRFHGNVAATGGGGVRYERSDSTLTNAIFSGNEARFGGAISVAHLAVLTITNSTVAGNAATDETHGGGGVIVWTNGHLNAHNTILSGNAATAGGDDLELEGAGTASLMFSLVPGTCPAGATCDHVLSGDPEFVRLPDPGADGTWGTSDDDYGDLRLTSASPAIDAGHTKLLPGDIHDLDGDGNTAEPLPEDIEGSPRVYDRVDIVDTGDGSVDMGAYETPPDHLYVDETGYGPHTGLSWAEAFTDVQHAMVWGRSGPMEIWVAEGTYTPGDSTYDSYALLSAMAVYGGFPGKGGSGGFEARDPQSYETILSGDIGVIGDYSDNVRIVVTSFQAAPTAILDGFTISSGYGHWCGGGWYNVSGDPTIRNVRLVRNRADSGAGMCNNFGSPTLTNVWFLGNVASEDGGGFYGNGYLSTAELANVVFSGNVAGGRGGGMMSDGGYETLVNVTFAANSASDGGGLAADDAAVAVHNTIFWGNDAGTADVSQIWSDSTTVTVVSSLIEGGCYAAHATCSGNILAADPLFARDPDPGSGGWGDADDNYGDLSIAPNSPAADAGDGEAVPLDDHDLDHDGCTAEKLPWDIAGNARFIDSPLAPDTGNPAPGWLAVVDMGAYEAIDLRVFLPLVICGG